MRSAVSPGSEKDITEVSGTSSPGSIPGRGTMPHVSIWKQDAFSTGPENARTIVADAVGQPSLDEPNKVIHYLVSTSAPHFLRYLFVALVR